MEYADGGKTHIYIGGAIFFGFLKNVSSRDFPDILWDQSGRVRKDLG
jgi:hypothetical protein